MWGNVIMELIVPVLQLKRFQKLRIKMFLEEILAHFFKLDYLSFLILRCSHSFVYLCVHAEDRGWHHESSSITLYFFSLGHLSAPSVGITDACHGAWASGSNSGPQACTISSPLTGPCPQLHGHSSFTGHQCIIGAMICKSSHL